MRSISKVVFHRLEDGMDRRGATATFVVTEVPNMKYVQDCAYKFVLGVISCGEEWPLDIEESLEEIRYGFGEVSDCWLKESLEDPARIVLWHKYWPDARTEAFKACIRALAPVHGYQVEEE